MNVRIAVVQLSIQQFAPDENLARAEHFLQQASGNADIVVFPEDFISGPLQGALQLADADGRYVRHFQQLARHYDLDIVPGSIIEMDAADGRLYNTAYYIDRTGTIKGRYRKINLWHPERSYITAGSEVEVFETAYGRVGLVICWDLIYPEVFRALLKQGAELVFCPSYWCYEDAGIGLTHDPDSEVRLINALCPARAFENEIVLVYANAADNLVPTKSLERPIGRSQIAVPFKGALCVLEHTHEEMFIQTVDTTLLQDAETAYTIRKDFSSR